VKSFFFKGNYFTLREEQPSVREAMGKRLLKNGENCITRNFIICTHYKKLSLIRMIKLREALWEACGMYNAEHIHEIRKKFW
jgi:hypothetical protein